MANPIMWVRHTENGENIYVPVPSGYQFDIEDASAQGAGRTEDVKMNKKRIGQAPAVTVEWRGLTDVQANAVLLAFDPEYVWVRYKDVKNGKESDGFFITKEFYTGNRTAVMYDCRRGLWESVKFKFVGREGK